MKWRTDRSVAPTHETAPRSLWRLRARMYAAARAPHIVTGLWRAGAELPTEYTRYCVRMNSVEPCSVSAPADEYIYKCTAIQI